ncbi:hypothetical protein FC83_GL001411 [Agrilactobacillus composti DSM 18527 = JCM 14202]|uniref:ABC transmembrane type-1 domain-containing protein n=1 Tax=Agrilactobacillus composti DSM 18527 = JCM 14202 TaxID=1423734 RepID=X0QMJ7_9LACO|nr:carbohydrate ABC transporter permease [Agrilactobacillus composti]KRM30850.1 hypothetical protein FC83_GL001411 [Agrilactobacillus composti DSM 18527 = JCM 14202]GAF39850.1 maltose/maltodextrin ABC transporter, permease protein MalG [Agrilactobacillus composti DSM 18527 = JCM 14202]
MPTKHGKGLRTGLLLIFICLSLFPVLVLLNTSLQTYQQIISWPPQWFQKLQLGNYRQVIFGSKSIVRPFLNSLAVALPTMVICVIVGILAAYAVTRFKFIGRKLFLVLVICTQMFSSVILINAMYLIFKQSQLLDTRLALIIANTASALPMTVWLLYSYFSQIPVIYEEAAWIDGCSRWQATRHILLPLSLPGIITAGLFAFITAWGDIVYANALITSPALRTLPQALTDFRDLYKTTWETQMAASMITIIPPLLIFIAIQKHLIRGLNRQAGQM